jgi:hypothetical protein
MFDWEKMAHFAPIVTATMALLAFGGAVISISVQRRIAQKRAAIDFFLKTEMDEKMLKAYWDYRGAVVLLTAAPDIAVFAASPDCAPIRSYLNVHELLAVGVNRHIFHDAVSKAYWVGELERACKDCNRLLLHLKANSNEKITYVELLKLNQKWQRGW